MTGRSRTAATRLSLSRFLPLALCLTALVGAPTWGSAQEASDLPDTEVARDGETRADDDSGPHADGPGAPAPLDLDATGVAVAEPPVLVGPLRGALVVAGGGPLGREIWERFVELAGGPSAEIVVIPTAGTEETFPDDWDVLRSLRNAGAPSVALLHTRDPSVANSEDFVAPLRTATGVWIPGGRQHRLVEAYLHTRVHDELVTLLDRGGVVGGSSAGASIQASFLVRGDPESNQIVMSKRYVEGFGLLDHAAVDQHLLTRNRTEDLWLILDIHPDLLGIGLDEGTALVIEGNRAEVIGVSKAILYDNTDAAHRTRTLEAGGVFDLGLRDAVEGPSGIPSVPTVPAPVIR